MTFKLQSINRIISYNQYCTFLQRGSTFQGKINIYIYIYIYIYIRHHRIHGSVVPKRLMQDYNPHVTELYPAMMRRRYSLERSGNDHHARLSNHSCVATVCNVSTDRLTWLSSCCAHFAIKLSVQRRCQGVRCSDDTLKQEHNYYVRWDMFFR